MPEATTYATVFDHPTLGRFVRSFGAWEQTDHSIGDRVIELALFDGDVSDFEIIAQFVDSFTEIETRLHQRLVENHGDIVGLLYEFWEDEYPELLAEFFGSGAKAADVTSADTWRVLRLNSAGFFNETGDFVIKVDYAFPADDVDQVVCFELNGAFEIVCADIES